MDKNKLIGLILISAILIFYTHFWGSKPKSLSVADKGSNVATMPSDASKPVVQSSIQPSIFAGTTADTPEQEVVLENKDIKVTFSSKGGIVKEVTLKNHQDYQGRPLVLLDANSSEMGFQFTANKVEVNTHQLQFDTVRIKG